MGIWQGHTQPQHGLTSQNSLKGYKKAFANQAATLFNLCQLKMKNKNKTHLLAIGLVLTAHRCKNARKQPVGLTTRLQSSCWQITLHPFFLPLHLFLPLLEWCEIFQKYARHNAERVGMGRRAQQRLPSLLLPRRPLLDALLSLISSTWSDTALGAAVNNRELLALLVQIHLARVVSPAEHLALQPLRTPGETRHLSFSLRTMRHKQAVFPPFIHFHPS